MIRLEESFDKYYKKLEEDLLTEDSDEWKYKLLPLGSKEAYQKLTKYTFNEYGIYTKDAQYWPNNKRAWQLKLARADINLKENPILTLNNITYKGNVSSGRFEGNPIFIFDINEVMSQLKKAEKAPIKDLLKEHGIRANNQFETTIELQAGVNNIRLFKDIEGYVVIMRDKNNNFFKTPVFEKYSPKILKLIDTVHGRLDPESIEIKHEELGEAPVLSIEFVSCNLEQKLEFIEELPEEERKKALSKINENQYELNRQAVIQNQDKYHVSQKLNLYSKINKDTGEVKLVQVKDWDKKAAFADGFYKENKLRQKNGHWAVTDGNIIFANAATALLYYGEPERYGDRLYNACDGIYGKHDYNDKRWRYATGDEIRKAKDINWNK